MKTINTTFYFKPERFNFNPVEFATSHDKYKLMLYADGVIRGNKVLKCAAPSWIYNDKDYVAIKHSEVAPEF